MSGRHDDARQFQRRLRWGPKPTSAIVWSVLALVWLVVAVLVGYALTSPWPSRGPGGGIGRNVWGPLVTCAAAVLPVVVSGVLRFRRRRTS